MKGREPGGGSRKMGDHTLSPHRKQKEDRKGGRLYNFKASFKWHNSFRQAPPLKGSITFPSSRTRWEPSVQTQDPIGGHFSSKAPHINLYTRVSCIWTKYQHRERSSYLKMLSLFLIHYFYIHLHLKDFILIKILLHRFPFPFLPPVPPMPPPFNPSHLPHSQIDYLFSLDYHCYIYTHKYKYNLLSLYVCVYTVSGLTILCWITNRGLFSGRGSFFSQPSFAACRSLSRCETLTRFPPSVLYVCWYRHCSGLV